MSPVIAVMCVLDKINPDWPERFDAWADRRYYAACGTWRWRFWFEFTGQGADARRYLRAIRRGRKRWGGRS